LSLEEAPEVARIAAQANLSLPLLISPVTSPDRWKKIAATATGFIYYMSVSGITGERDQLPPELVENVRHLRSDFDRPVIVGFGISKAEHVRQVCREADGAIIGSALVRRIMEAQDQGKDTQGIVQVATSAVREWMTGLP
jgi:tryptophan synthase alpha chain